MNESTKGLIAMIGTATIWGLSPLVYKPLSHIPPAEVLAHRLIWSLAFFVVILLYQRRPGAIVRALRSGRDVLVIAMSSLLIAVNWFLFIWSIQIDRATESALGYYIYPLLAVLIGRLVFGERLGTVQWFAVATVAVAVALLTFGLGAPPWIALMLATTFSLYGVIKKQLELGPVVSVTVEVLILSPVAVFVLWQTHHSGGGHFGAVPRDTALLILSGPLTAIPLILFSHAARRLPMTGVGLLSYINPTLQFCCAVFVFSEPFTGWHLTAFCLIWMALVLYSVTSVRQDKARRRAARAAAASTAGVI